MTLQDYVAIAQTIILFLTGVVVTWYTIETTRIRKSTTRQADLLAQQLQMLRTQVETERQRHAEADARLVREAQPTFHYVGGDQDFTRSIFNFSLIGTHGIRDLALHEASGYEGAVTPTPYVGPGDTLSVRIVALPRPTPAFAFAVDYTDTFGVRRRRRFEHPGTDGGPIRDVDVPLAPATA